MDNIDEIQVRDDHVNALLIQLKERDELLKKAVELFKRTGTTQVESPRLHQKIGEWIYDYTKLKSK